MKISFTYQIKAVSEKFVYCFVPKSNFESALLTRTEVGWLLGKVKVSKPYEYRIKSDIRKKIKAFTELELPLLIQHKIIDNFDLSKYTQSLRTNPQIHQQNISTNSSILENCGQNMVGRKG